MKISVLLFCFSVFCFLRSVPPLSAQTAGGPLVPIVELKTKGLMGGAQNGEWLTAARTAAGMKAKTEFTLAGLRGIEEGGVTFGSRGETEDVCQDFYRMNFEPSQDSGVAVGSAAEWNPVPRVPQALAADGQIYKTAVGDFLKKKGIARTTIKITQIYRVDLEGDGREEVVIAATFYKNGLASNAKVGDYSLVLVRKALGKAAADYLLAGDFVTKNVAFGAPNEYQISAIADLNGDGRMEVVVYGQYYEGEFAAAYEMKAGRPVEIKALSIGCGV